MTDTSRSAGPGADGHAHEGHEHEPHEHEGHELQPYSDVEYVFEAHSASLDTPRQYIQDVWDRRRFAVALAQSELRGPRANTVLGELWGVLDPLFQAGIYFFLITVIRRSSTGATQQFLLIVSGFFLFTFTATAIGEGGRSILRNKGLVLNSTFPRALLPVSVMYKAFLALIPSLLVYVVLALVLGAPIGSGLFLLPFLFLLQVLMSFGLALIFATLTVYIRDMSNVLDYIMRILLLITPVIYPASSLGPTLRLILSINPFFSLFTAYQAVFGGGMPTAPSVFVAVVWAIVLPIAGFRIFVTHERGFGMRL